MAASIVVRPIEFKDVAGFRAAVDEVARERRYLAVTEAYPVETTATFVAANISVGNPHLVAADDDRVVGWCDVRRNAAAAYSHTGLLGVGLLGPYRGRGIGERLVRAALAAAAANGFERVELSVYGGNARAQKLYRRIGFVEEGIRKNGFKMDGRYDDVIMMAYFT